MVQSPDNFKHRAIHPAKSPRFLVGRDCHGNWVVRDQAKASGRVFTNRTEALHFAMLENDIRPLAVVMVATGLEARHRRIG